MYLYFFSEVNSILYRIGIRQYREIISGKIELTWKAIGKIFPELDYSDL